MNEKTIEKCINLELQLINNINYQTSDVEDCEYNSLDVYKIRKELKKSNRYMLNLITFRLIYLVNYHSSTDHFLGFNLMPRRIPDFPDSFHSWNFLSSIGSGITFLSFAIFIPLVHLLYQALCHLMGSTCDGFLQGRVVRICSYSILELSFL